MSSELDVVIKQDVQVERRKPVFCSGMLIHAFFTKCFYTKIVGSRSMFVHIYVLHTRRYTQQRRFPF